MSDIQDKINQILSNPEALKQVQSLGEQLGLSQKETPPKLPEKAPIIPTDYLNDDMLRTITNLAPVMQSMKSDDDTTRLLNSLRPFLGADKQHRLDQAERMLKLLKILPLLKNNGLF